MNYDSLPKAENQYDTGDSFDDLLVDVLWNPHAPSRSLKDVNLSTLSPFQRSLLTIDGTVTKYLETYTLEPIEVIRLRHETKVLSVAHDWLKTQPNTEVLVREVLLRGVYTETTYAYAVSMLVPMRLPVELLQVLESEPGGIGRALLSSRIENRREMLWRGRECLSQCPEEIRALLGDDFLSRAYSIIVGGEPVMLINEKFPANVDCHGCPPSNRPYKGGRCP